MTKDEIIEKAKALDTDSIIFFSELDDLFLEIKKLPVGEGIFVTKYIFCDLKLPADIKQMPNFWNLSKEWSTIISC